jgi:hypothetical protein
MITQRMRGARYVVHMEDRRKVDKILIGEPEGTRPLGRYKHTHIHYNIKVYLT